MENSYPFCIELLEVNDLAPGSSLKVNISASTAVARGLKMNEKELTEFVVETSTPSKFLKECHDVTGWFPKLGIKASGPLVLDRRKGWMRTPARECS